MPAFADDLFLGTANGYQGTGLYATTAVFTGAISSTTLTVTQMLSGDPIVLGMYVEGTSVADGTYVTAFGTGAGGAGTYTVSTASTATSTTLYGMIQAPLQNPAPMPQGVGPLGRVYVWDSIPQTLNTAAIAASQTPAAAGALTLTAGAGTQSVRRSDGVTVVQLDCPRAVSISLVVGGTARAYTVAGYDVYGQPMSEVITSVANATTPGLKAFFQVVSVTGAGGGSTTAVTVGTTDVLGCPVRILDLGYIIHAGYNNVLADNAGTAVAAVTATATTSTGDVRGTFTPASATNGLRRLVMSIALPAIATGPYATRTGAYGVTQA
jgi:hypothetical protein